MIRHACLALVIATPLAAAMDPRVEFAWGVLAECRGETAAAATRFENALAADPHAAALVQRGAARRLANGDRADAIRLYRERAAARPDDPAARMDYADFLTEQGKGDALALKLATETLEPVLAKHPGTPEIIRRLIAIDRSRSGLLEQLSPEDPEAVLLYASLSRSLHDPDDARVLAGIDRRFLLAFDAHPDHPVLAREASEHFRNTGRPEKAIDVLTRHTAAAPWSLDLRVRLGVLYYTAKRDTEGGAMLKQVLAIHPGHALAHLALAKRHRLGGNPGPAAFHTTELLKIRGGLPSDFLKPAEELLAAGNPRGARLLLERAVFDHPDHAGLRMNLALATHRDPETRARAPRLFREAEAAAPGGKITDPAFLTESAEAMIAAGQVKAGEERLRAAIRAFPADAKKDTAAALRRLAALWTGENRNADAARALLLRADSLDPEP